jgi:hypothetical protein
MGHREQPQERPSNRGGVHILRNYNTDEIPLIQATMEL